MAKFLRVAGTADVAPGAGIVASVNGKEYAVFNLDGTFRVIDNTCLHRGGPLGEGELDGDVVTCHWHGWQYNVQTGAWGAAFGNVIGDLFGTLGPGSLFGLLGNFLYGYVPYRLWGRLGALSSGRPPEPRSPRQILEYALICILASLACAGTIGWGLDVMRLLPFQVLAPVIFLNNVLMSSLLGPPLLLFLYPRVARCGLLYADGPHDRKATWVDSPVPAQAQPAPDAPRMLIRDLHFTYRNGAHPALHGLSLSVKAGTLSAVLGGSGAGKSTLCYCLNGLIPHYLPGEFSGTV